MKHLIYILLFISLSLQAQKGMVKINMPVTKEFEIPCPDEFSERVRDEFLYAMEHSKVNYQSRQRKLKRIEKVIRDRDFVWKIENGVIYINARLDQFPYCKRAVILQVMYVNQGGEVDNKKRVMIDSNFSISDYAENQFRKQYKHHSTIYRIVDKLENR